MKVLFLTKLRFIESVTNCVERSMAVPLMEQNSIRLGFIAEDENASLLDLVLVNFTHY